MNVAVFIWIVGPVLLAWGGIIAIFNQWASRWMKKMQSIYGERAAAMVTPGYVRFIGIMIAAFGVLFIVLSLAGVFPNKVS